jgi:hypothetical protein
MQFDVLEIGKNGGGNSAGEQRRFVLFGVLTLLWSQASHAQWELDPVLRVAWDYDDNATLNIRTDAEQEISGYIAEASINLRNSGERGFFSVTPMFRSRNYGSDNDRNSDDQFLNIGAGYDGVRNRFRFITNYEREGVRTAEAADADLDTEIDPDDIPDDESGRVFSQERRERIRVIPRWSFRLSDVSAINADVTYLDVMYSDDNLPRTLFDYRDTRLRLGYSRDFSSRTNAALTLTTRNYVTERDDGDRTGYGFAASVGRSLTETTRIRAAVGMEKTERNIEPEDAQNDPNLVYDFSIIRNMETTRLLAQYRQRIAPSGRGRLTKRDEFNLRFTRNLTERFSAGLGVRAYTVNSLDNEANEQDYVQLRGQVIWQLSQVFAMQADYRYTVIDRAALGEGANSNRITVWLTYQPNPLARRSAAVIR